MNRDCVSSRHLGMLIAIVLSVNLALPGAASYASAQTTTPLVVSVPLLWEDVLTPEVLSEFEAQYPGVDVIVNFSETIRFSGFGGLSIEDHLDSTEERVMAADVLYVDLSSLTAADTQAGYFLNLAPLVMSDPAMDPGDYAPAVWQSYQWDNGMWALPLSVDVILLTYDPVAFDEAGLAYPNERWTVDDFANAARALTEYNADGTVSRPGFSAVSGGDYQSVLLRALAGASFYDPVTVPNPPSFSNPALEYALQVWAELVQEGVVLTTTLVQGNVSSLRIDDIPLRVEGINGYSRRGFNNQDDEVRYASLLPGGTAGLNVQGFAVSAGTQYPELAYALASFLTSRPELANNAFSAAPARSSLVGTQPTNNADVPNGGLEAGPGGPFLFAGNRTIPEAIQPVVDQGLAVALPVSELRYVSYLSAALTDLTTNGTDARSALQAVEAQALSDMQTATARAGTVELFVTPPATPAPLAAGEIQLTCAINLGFGGMGRGSQLPNQDEWDRLIADFVAGDPEVGAVVLEATQESDLVALAEQYDCFILPSNAVEGADVSPLLNLDPLLDADPTFDRNDVIGNILAQLQQDNRTWALPLAIQPQMLEYDPEQFAQAGVPEPVNGWTVDAFVDALRMLKPYDTDPAPFQPNDPSGSYLMMLIAAFGGLPLDYRTDPPTVNFTDPATVDAIRQVLDLAVNGYISYTGLANFIVAGPGKAAAPAITTNTLSQFRVTRSLRPGDTKDAEEHTLVTTTYPQGSQYSVIAFEITTGYISASAQNPDAAYRFLSEVARSPQLFFGMPARQSLVNDPAVVAAQGEEIAAVYQQLDALLRAPNTIVFPTFKAGLGGGGLTMIQSYWLRKAMDAYVMEGADLEAGLAEAEAITLAYMDCVQSITVDASSSAPDQFGEQFRLMSECATMVDPSFSLGD